MKTSVKTYLAALKSRHQITDEQREQYAQKAEDVYRKVPLSTFLLRDAKKFAEENSLTITQALSLLVRRGLDKV